MVFLLSVTQSVPFPGAGHRPRRPGAAGAGAGAAAGGGGGKGGAGRGGGPAVASLRSRFQEDSLEVEHVDVPDHEGGGAGPGPVKHGRDKWLTVGEWKLHGDVWRRDIPEEKAGTEDFSSPDREWFERRGVQERLDFKKFIGCKDGDPDPQPTLEDYDVTPGKIKINDFIVHQGNLERLGKGEDAERADRIRRPENLPKDGNSVLMEHRWGTCAIVGNSGHLRLTQFARAIDSHDTVVRLNVAPVFGYHRRVGRKTTHRVLNKLWTRSYRNGKGMKKGVPLPLEKGLTFVVTRANSQEFELLTEYLAEEHPDAKAYYLSSRACSMAQPLLTEYREALCQAGYGPYKGLNVPSSGYVIIQILMRLCDKVTVYGFGVEGMGQKGLDFDYHYYKGTGSRHVGDDVHCFDNEEKVVRQMGQEGFVDFCGPTLPLDADANWSCGCRHANVEECRPPPLPKWIHDEDDCEEDDCETPQQKEKRRAEEARNERRAHRAAGGGGSPSSSGRGHARGSRRPAYHRFRKF